MSKRSSPVQWLVLPLRLSLLALVAIAISGNFTNYGGMQEALQTDLGMSSQSIGLLSTFLYVGIAVGYVSGGVLVDRFGPKQVIIAALVGIGLFNEQLALLPSLKGVLQCRLLIGVAAGIAIVAGSQSAARLPGRAAPIGQGLFGGAMQVGAGIGLVASPFFLSFVEEWETIFALWGLLALVLALVWMRGTPSEPPADQAQQARRGAAMLPRLLVAFRERRLLLLGLVHLGSLGMGQAVAPWLAVFFASTLFHLSLAQAAAIGACGLLLGAMTRPLGGILLTHGPWKQRLLRLSGGLAWGGLLVLVLCPTALQMLFAGQAPPVAHVLVSLGGVLLAVAGWTLPYSSVFAHADRIGQAQSLGRGTAQSVAMLLSAPASAFGPAFIGWLHAQASFPSIFALLCWIQLGILVLAFLLEPSLVRTGNRSARMRTRRLSLQGHVPQTWASP
jgi:MFS family permease